MQSDGRDLALVLSGGGARAAYQVGVLGGIAERAGGDLRFPIVTGVSAGAINAGSLSAHVGSLAAAADVLAGIWLGMSVEKVFNPGLFSIAGSALKWMLTLGSGGLAPGFKLRGLLDTDPLRHFLGGLLHPEGIETNLASGRLRAAAVSATSYSTGKTVTFVQGGKDRPMWERRGRRSVHARLSVDVVLASSALPLLFPAVKVNGEWFGDGSVRQTAPLAPAIHLGAGRILAISLRRSRTLGESEERQIAGYPPPAQVLGMLFNAVFLDALNVDAERLERVNRALATRPPGSPHPDGLQPVRLALLHPSKDLGRLASDLTGSLPRSLRILLRGMGVPELKTPDVLSYLLFERPYVERLLELGRADARANWDRLAPVLEG